MPDAARRVWIQSPAYDLPLISLAPLTGLLICAFAIAVGESRLLSWGFVEANFFVLGMPHYLSSYTFYLGEENQREYFKRKLAFVFGPVIVLAVMLGSYALHLYYFVAVVVATWNVFHVARQSAGILSVYRHRAGGDNAREKVPAMLALIGSAAGLFCIALDRQHEAAKILGRALPLIVNAGAPLLLIAAAIGLGRLVVLMRKRSARAAEWVFLAASIMLFAPYVIVRDFTLATSALLAGHFIQYLGLLWLVNRRKYASLGGPLSQRLLAATSRNGALLAVVLLSLILVPLGFDRFLHMRHWMGVHTVWLNGIVLLHFYLDGLFWAFKDPYTRQSLGPFLVPYEAAPARVAAPLAAAAS